ncbi:MAG: hypothetical protein LBU60_01645 [Clostridiales bacterium]|jgi:hypothetical protein|nr:hypothetical protein [Clostridiales bacterium]
MDLKELLALKELGSGGFGGTSAVWAIFIVILIALVLVWVGFGKDRRGALFDEANFVRADEIQTHMDANHHRNRTVSREDIKLLETQLRDENKLIREEILVAEGRVNDNILKAHEKQNLNFMREIDRLDRELDRKEDKRHRKPAFEQEGGAIVETPATVDPSVFVAIKDLGVRLDQLALAANL